MAQVVEGESRPASAWQVATPLGAVAGGPGRRAWGPGLVLAAGFVVFVALVGVLAPVLAPHDPIKQDLGNAIAGPSAQHLLGTDDFGRDVLSRLIWGARPALLGVLVAITTASVIGLPWGLVAGYAGGAVDLVLMRLADALLVLPGLVIAIAITTALGASLTNAMLAVGIVFSPVVARVLRSGVLTVRDREYVVVTRMYGLRPRHRMLQHVLPNAVGPAVIQLTLLTGISLLAQAALGFLGIGVQPPAPSWGDSLASGYKFIIVDPAATAAPAVVIVLTVLAIYRLGDALRDRLEIPA
ncbi:MAG TPA: ABC transporter permease [Candidatus Dormibacteraeota bacterium]|nr:ABC transporter permease [Candidatus Dormibacteraeota bacterium]